MTISTTATGEAEVRGRTHSPLYRNHIFFSLCLPSQPITANCPVASSPAQTLCPGSSTAANRPSPLQVLRAGAGSQAHGDRGAKEMKLPSTEPLKIIPAFSKAAFARCQGKNCLSRHLSVLVKKQKACQGWAGSQDREGFLCSAG